MADDAADTTSPEPVSVQEMVGSLTGFDEIAIEQKFKGELNNLGPTMTMRALVFVQERRAGADDKAAYGEAMRMTLSAINDRFRDDDAAEGKG